VTLVDNSVWVDHLHDGDSDLAEILNRGEVLCHPFVIGELACGCMKNRTEILCLLAALPVAVVADHDEVLHLVNEHQLMGKGLGWIDVHLLASALLTGCTLWTRDKAVLSAAVTVGINV
jgi:predicted nucleic acid-binding protein